MLSPTKCGTKIGHSRPLKVDGASAEILRYVPDAFHENYIPGWGAKPYYNKGAPITSGLGSDMSALAT